MYYAISRMIKPIYFNLFTQSKTKKSWFSLGCRTIVYFSIFLTEIQFELNCELVSMHLFLSKLKGLR